MSPTARADLMLLVAAVVWGAGFVAQRTGMDHVGPLTFTAARFAIGAMVLIPVALAIRRRRSDAIDDCRAGIPLTGGVIGGVVVFLAAVLQQRGIVETTAGKAGFITGLSVVFVPILGLFFGQRARGVQWIGAILAALGLYLLSGAADLTRLNPGDGFVLLGAVGWGAHILVVGHFSPRSDPLRFAIVQFVLCATLAGVAALAFEPMSASALRSAAPSVLYAGVFSVGVSFTLQVVAQRHAPPAHAAILLSLEAVAAAVAGAILLREALTPTEMLGGAIMVAGAVVAQWPDSRAIATNTAAS